MTPISMLLTPDQTARVLIETISILNATTQTTELLYGALMKFRERKVRFVVGAAESMDPECDRAFDEICVVLRTMGENIPQRIANVLMDAECTSAQNAPTTGVLQ